MARGRKAQPAAVKEAKGNPGKRPISKVEAEVPDHPEDAPAWLTGTHAINVWKTLRRDLGTINLIKSTDQMAFARYCYYLGEWIKAANKLKRERKVYTTESQHGTMKRVHPLLTVQLRYEQVIIKLEEQIGLTPAARQSILQRVAQQPNLPFTGRGGETPKQDPVPEADPLLGGLQPKAVH